MFGTLRLTLAVMVAIAHVGYERVYGISPGQVAVVCFYIISGFVMTGIIRSYYFNKTGSFYIDRIMRIYPQYLFFVFLTITMFWISGSGPWFIWKDGYDDKINYLYNLTLVPLDFSKVAEINQLIPVAWTLGLEIQFYIVLPFLLRRFKLYLLLYSIIIFSFASYGILNGELFCYYLLPGTLFIFLSGSLLYDIKRDKDKANCKYIASILYVYILVLFVVGIKSMDSIVMSVFIGYLVGIPLIFILSLLKRREFDEFLGNISYGVYLSHMFVIWFTRHYAIFKPEDNILLFIFCSIFLGLTGYYLVERPVSQLRKRIRQKQCLQAK